jgi:hypothetical protein
VGQFSKNYRTFYSKIVTKLSKIWVWDPGSGKNSFPDPESATLASSHSSYENLLFLYLLFFADDETCVINIK